MGQRLTFWGKKKGVVGVFFSLLANSGQCENEDPKHTLFSQQNLVNGRHARVELRYVAGTVELPVKHVQLPAAAVTALCRWYTDAHTRTTSVKQEL